MKPVLQPVKKKQEKVISLIHTQNSDQISPVTKFHMLGRENQPKKKEERRYKIQDWILQIYMNR